MTHSVFIEQIRHFLGDHVTIVLNGNERDFFSHLGHGLWSGSFGGCSWSFWCLTHGESIHHAGAEKGSYSPSPNTPQCAAEARRGEPSVALAKEGSGFGTPPKGSGRRVREFRRIPRSFRPS